jgi:ketosteroid isomerase-like protein
MTEKNKLLEADAARRAAMVAGDAEALERLLSDELIWTHSSGRTDSKASFLEGIASGTVRYLALDVADVQVARYGEVLVCHGTLDGRASRDGVEKTLASRFLSVWRRRDDTFELLAWQSTAL